ncbi:MAG: sulfurtransferase TusA family protein [Thaumarchaeota archaeon]|jgi:TusA-related sulfurtransferase|nr:sulfurtransferase TusA family protein [Nitrososphaerota archaeon]
MPLKVSLSVDARGLSCPYPVKKAEEAIQKVEVGEVVEIITTDPGSKIDIPAWAEKCGHRVVEVVDRWLEIYFYVEKGSLSEPKV